MDTSGYSTLGRRLHLRGTVLPDDEVRDVYVIDGRITFTPVEGADTVVSDAMLLPGLVDVHAHLSLHSPAGDEQPPRQRIEASLRAHLDAGVLAIREPGGPDRLSTEYADAAGWPRLTTAGQFLAPAGRYFPGLAREVAPDDLPDAAVTELGHGTGWVKVIGDSPVPGPGISPTYDAATLAETATRVHAAGGRIAIHCSLPDVIAAAIDSRCDSLEHATMMPTDLVPALAESGATWVPTLSINATIRQLLDDPVVSRAIDAQAGVIQAAIDSGVTVLAGTDAGMGPHGHVRDEIALLIAAGVDPAVALGAGSWTARRWLGLPLLEEGAPADLVAFRDDPRADLEVLAHPEVVLLGANL